MWSVLVTDGPKVTVYPGESQVTNRSCAFKEVVVYSMLTVSLVHGIVMPRTNSYALNDNIQLKYLGYFHDISLYLGISLIISTISWDIFDYFENIFW